MHSKALLALLFTTLVWGVTPVFIRDFSLVAGPLDALLLRTFFVAVIFAVTMALTSGFKVAAPDIPRLVIISLVGVLGYFVFSIFGFAYAPAGVGTLIMSTQPLLISLLAWMAGTERLSLATILGLLISFGGSVLLVSGDDLATATNTTAEVVFGCGLIFICGICWSIFVVFSKGLIQTYGALKISGLSNILIVPPLALVLLFPQAGAAPLQTFLSLDAKALMALAFLTTVAAALSVVTWNFAAGVLQPSMLGASLYVVPVLAVLSGWAILDEVITWRIVLAAALILLGVAVAQLRIPRKRALALPDTGKLN